jgi:hypothetical protein
VFLSFGFSILGAAFAYYLYFNFIEGLNPFLRIVFTLPLIALISANIFLIVKEKLPAKRIALSLFMLVCFAISAFAIRYKLDQLKQTNGTPRRYLAPN